MKFRKARYALLMALLVLLSACGSTGEQAGGGDGGDGGASNEEPIVVGGTLGLTGAFSGPSAAYKAAYDYWLERINEEGGLLGRPVEMIIYDDESTPATAQSLYQRLVNEDQVDLLLAPYTTLIGGAIVPIAEANQMVLWNGGFVGIEIFEQSSWIVGSYSYQEPTWTLGVFEMIDALPEDQRPTRVGIATEQNPFTLKVRDGHNGEGGVLRYAEERGMEVVFNEEYAPDMADPSGLIEQAKAAGVEVFFSLSLPNPAGQIAQTAFELDFRPAVYCVCGSQVTTLPYWWDLGDAAFGITGTSMAYHSDDYPQLDELFQVLQEKFPDTYPEIPAYAPGGLAILQVMEQAVEGVGSLDQQALYEYVVGKEFMTANGPMRYDENGVPAFNAITVQFREDRGDGEPGNVVVWPQDRATGEPIIPMP